MKNIHFVSIIFLGIIAFACQSTEAKNGEGDLQALEKMRDSLSLVVQDLNAQLFEVENKLQSEREKAGVAKRFPVRTMVLEPQVFEHYIKVQGSVAADRSVMLNAETSGSLKNIYTKEGSKVSRGQLLISLDTYVLDNQLKELETAYELADVVFKKQDKLWKQNIGSEIEYLQAKNRKESLQTQMATLKSQKDKSQIRAPFSGTVDAVFPKIGESVNPGTPILRLINMDQVKIESEISERHVNKIGKGSKVLVKLPQLNDYLNLNIDYTSSYINPANRTYRVSSKLDNTDGRFLPNMVTDMALRDYVNEKAVVVPNKAILEDLDGKYYVYIVTKSGELPKVSQRTVTLGMSYEGLTEITSGLEGNEQVIIEGAKSVNPGDVVSVMNS